MIFFVIYYIISLSGEKLAKEGNWEAVYGMWLSTFILTPIAIYLTYKATNDSALLDIGLVRRTYQVLQGAVKDPSPNWMSALAGKFKRKPDEKQ